MASGRVTAVLCLLCACGLDGSEVGNDLASRHPKPPHSAGQQSTPQLRKIGRHHVGKIDANVATEGNQFLEVGRFSEHTTKVLHDSQPTSRSPSSALHVSLISQPSVHTTGSRSPLGDAMDWDRASSHSLKLLPANQSSFDMMLSWESEFLSALRTEHQMSTIAIGTVLVGCVVVCVMFCVTLMSMGAEVHAEPKLRCAVFVASINHFCMGYNAGIIAGTLSYIEQDPDFAPLSSTHQGMLVSCLLAGATVGAACCSLSDCYGRRTTLQMVSVIFLVGPAIMCAAPNLGTLIAGRFVTGWSVGLTSGLVNVYIAEIAPANHRGKLGGMAPFFGTCGIIVAYMTSVLLGLFPGGAWRFQLGLAMLPAVCFLLFQDIVQETPRWLLAQGRHEEAQTNVGRLYPRLRKEEIESFLDCISEENALSEANPDEGWWTLIVKHRRSFALGTAINVLQQLSGVNIVIYFGPSILRIAGFGTSGAMITTLFVSLTQLSATGALIGWVDRIGRRPVALVGSVVMVIGHALLVVAFGMMAANSFSWSACAWVAVAGMLLFRTAFSLSLGPLPYIMTTELFPQQVRAVGVAWSWTCNWGSNFVVSMLFPPLVDVLTDPMGHKLAIAAIFSVFCVFSALTVVFVLVALPETAGLSLEVVSSTEVLLRKKSWDQEDTEQCASASLG